MKFYKSIVLISIIFLSLVNCATDEIKEQLKIETENSILIYSLKDSVKNGVFYEINKFSNDTVKKGTFLDGQRIGYWDYFDENGKLKLKEEYIMIRGKSFFNQKWKYTKDSKDLDSIQEFHYSKVYDNHSILKIILETPINNQLSYTEYYKSGVVIGEFNGDYSNTMILKADTLSMNNNYIDIDINVIPKTYKRGYILEQAIIPYYGGKKAVITKKMYFEISN